MLQHRQAKGGGPLQPPQTIIPQVLQRQAAEKPSSWYQITAQPVKLQDGRSGVCSPGLHA